MCACAGIPLKCFDGLRQLSGSPSFFYLFVVPQLKGMNRPPPPLVLSLYISLSPFLSGRVSLSHWVAHVPALSSWRRGANLGQQFQERRQRTATVKPPCGLLVQVVLMGEQQGEKGTGLTQH